MKRNAFSAWTELAWKIGELSVASTQVIAQRTARIAAAGVARSERDRREFSRMGQEKLDAAFESAQAMGAQLAAVNMRNGADAYAQMMRSTSDFAALLLSRNTGQFIARHAKLVRTLNRSAKAVADLPELGIGLAARGLKPVHGRATANARRLRKR